MQHFVVIDMHLKRTGVAILLLLASLNSFSQSSNFRFAWLSDTHVGSQTGAEDLRRSVADINSMNDIAFVILSGDVTEFGSDAQLRDAKRLLDSLNKPWYAIPGNHDTKWSESGCTTFPKLFGSDKFVFDYGKFRFIGLHQGPRMRMGDGHWAPEDMRLLDTVLAGLRNKQQPLIFVTHYPVDSSISNWYVMLEKVKKYNTQVILHGHGHRNRSDNFEGVPGIMSRSNLRAQNSVGGYTIAEVRNDTLFVSERTPGFGSGSPWQHVVLGMKDYEADTTHYPRPDFSVNEKYDDVKVIWKFSTGYTITSTPAIAQESVFFGDASGKFRSISLSDGHLLWSFQTGGAIYSSPSISSDGVEFASTDGIVYSLNRATGHVRWRFDWNSPIVASPSVATRPVFRENVWGDVEQRIVIGGSDGIFRALDSKSGRVVWEYKEIQGFVEARPLVYDSKVIFGAWDGHLYALDEKTGELQWKWTGDNQGVLLSPAACTPVGARGSVFIVAPDRMLTAIDAKTGRTIWRTGEFQVRESIGKSEQDYKFYIRTLRDSILAISSYTQEPDIRWCTNVGFGYDHNYAALVEKGGTLYYGTRTGLLITLDALNGSVKWMHRTGVALLNTVAPIDGRRGVVSNVDGDVMLIEAEV